VAGLPETSHVPSPATAWGVYRGMKACALLAFGDESLRGRVVAIQGMGSVGRHLARHLHEEGARLVVTDIHADRVEPARREFGAQVVAPEAIYGVECDIFSPNALGAAVNDRTVEELKCKIIAGGANNQLATPRHGRLLAERGILYAPDFVINGGGVTNVADEYGPGGYSKSRAYDRISRIYDKVLEVLSFSREQGIYPHEAAHAVAKQRLEAVGQLKRMHVPRC